MPRLVLVATLLTGGLSPTARLSAADPLDCVPASAQVVLVADSPRKLAESVTNLDAFQDALKLAPVQALLETAQVKRAKQLLAFAEFGLGAKWPELLDRLTGNGVALAFQYPDGADAPPALLVLSGKDEKLAARAYPLAWRVIEDELTRQGVKEKPVRETVRGVEVTRVADAIHAARVGATVLISNKAAALEAAIEQATSDQAKTRIHPARRDTAKILPKEPLAWLWLNLKAVKESKAAKDFFDATRTDFLQTLAAGTVIDSVRRSDFLAVGLYREPAGFRLRVRLPAGRDGMWDQLLLHVPPKGKSGILPLLEPPGTIYSHSLHLDIAYMWTHRDKLVNEEFRKNFEMVETQISKVLPSNVKLGDLLGMWGPYHRVVVANHDMRPYKTEPALKLPAFGYVASARDPKFARALDPILRSAALVGTFQFGWKMKEHEHEGVTLTAYRFPEKKVEASDPDGLRFNFEPCFAVVGNDLVLATTAELGKKLITELKKPQSAKGSSAVVQGKLFAKAGAEALEGAADPFVTDAVLGRGIGLAEARKEIAALVGFVKSLGTVELELDVTDTEYRVDLVWNVK